MMKLLGHKLHLFHISMVCMFCYSLLIGSPTQAVVIEVPGQYTTIQAAIDAADSVAVDTVRVKPQEYYETIMFGGKNVFVTSCAESSKDTLIDTTIINGGRSQGSVVTFEAGEDSSAVLRGFTITGGHADKGGGIYIYNASPKILWCRIAENECRVSGGGIYREQGLRDSCGSEIPSVIRDNVIENNGPTGDAIYIKGGGIYITRANTILQRNRISENVANQGGGIYVVQAGPALINNRIYGNKAQFDSNNRRGTGGGVSCVQATPFLVNNVIDNNYAASEFSGAGLHVYQSDVIVVKCSIVDNKGPGVYVNRGSEDYQYAHALLNSCVVWGDSTPIDTLNGGQVTVRYSDVGPAAEPYDGEGNLQPCNPGYDNEFCLPPGTCVTDSADPGLPLDSDGSQADVGYTCDFSWSWCEIDSLWHKDPLERLFYGIRYNMPGWGSYKYDRCEPDTLAIWAHVAAAMELGEPELHAGDIAALNYDLLQLDDCPGLWILKERLPIQHGWGTFAWQETPLRPNLQIHVDHPVFDYGSLDLGLAAFRDLGARWLLVAGTHRYANSDTDEQDCESDMARNPKSPFQRVFETVLRAGDRTLSFHTFSRQAHNVDYYMALSAGAMKYGIPSTIVNSDIAGYIAEELETTFGDTALVCVATATAQCDSLGASQNRQGNYVNQTLSEPRWLSLEVATEFNAVEALRAVIVTALVSGVAVPCLPAVGLQLHPATPNPFNPRTMISFDLAQAQRVTLVIFDLRGRRRRLLIEREMTAGRHEVVWDGRDDWGRLVGAGTYLCRLAGNEMVKAMKIALIR